MLKLEEEDIYAGIAKPASGGGDTPESAKGSFNASTQQLTLNYDYLVEMINSSTEATAEQKSAMITLLDNQSPTFDMTLDVAEENQYLWVFSSDDPTVPVLLQVDKATPCTLKLAFTGDSIAGIGSWQAMADYMSMSGETVTAEMVEAMYGSFVVDDNLCTISGTIDNFSIEFGKDEPDTPITEKYGATIGNFLGDVDSNGKLQTPSGEDVKNLSFDGVADIGSVVVNSVTMSSLLSCKFYGAQNIGAVSFPDLTNMRIESMYGAFAFSSATSLSFPKLTIINGYPISNMYIKGMAEGCTSLTSVSFDALTTISVAEVFARAFKGCTSLTTVSFPELTTIAHYGVFGSSSSGIGGAFEGCTALTTVSFPKLSSMTSSNTFKVAFRNCTALTSVSFPALTSTGLGSSTNHFNDMLSGCTGVTVHFPSNLQSVMGSWSDVTAGFGGTSTTISFDLPATE